MHTNRFRLTACERSALEALVHDSSTPRRVLQRIHIVWMSAMGSGARSVAAEVGVSEHTVRLWISRFREAGVDGLRDLPRPGAPRIHGDDVLATIRATASCSPAEQGLPQRRWTLDTMLGYLTERHGIVIGRSRLHELLREAGVDWRNASSPADQPAAAAATARGRRLERLPARRITLPAHATTRSSHRGGHRHEPVRAT